MPFCSNCGKELESGALFCGGCGSAVAAQNERDAVVVERGSAGVTGSGKKKASKKLPKKWIWAIGGAVVLVLVLSGLALFALPRFIEARNKTKMADAPRLLASFESALLAALTEKEGKVGKSDIVFSDSASKWFTLEISADAKYCKAVAMVDIGKFKKGSHIATTYNVCADGFVSSSDNEAAVRELIPDFSFKNSDAASGNASDSGKTCFKDYRDGKKYKTVTIGGKTWMAENLNYQTSSGSWCYAKNDSNCGKYGRLYDWKTAKKACPAGWHLPSRREWDDLARAVGGKKGYFDAIQNDPYKYENVYYWYGTGKKLKATSGWNVSGNGTDEYGFSALPGGYRNYNGTFIDVKNHGIWWTAEERWSGIAYCQSMGYDNNTVLAGYDEDGGSGFSVRCCEND